MIVILEICHYQIKIIIKYQLQLHNPQYKVEICYNNYYKMYNALIDFINNIPITLLLVCYEC